MTADADTSGGKRPQWTRWVAMLLLTAFPGLATLALVAYYYDVSLATFLPSVNDEINYWHEILSFASHGFNSGYYTVEEIPAAAAFTPFGCHGPVFTMIYGVAARLFGWTTSSPPLFNLALITGSLVLFFLLARPDKSRLFLVAAVILTFWPLLIYIPSMFQETFHFAVALLLAAMMHLVYTRNETDAHAPIIKGFLFFILLTASLVRPTWSLLFPVVMLACSRRRSKTAVAVLLTGGAALTAAFHAIYIWFSAPFPVGFAHNMILLGRTSAAQAITYASAHFVSNLERLLHLRGDFALETYQRWQAVALVLIALVLFSLQKIKGRSMAVRDRTGEDYLFHVMNLGPVLVIILLLYELVDLKDFRVIAPHLLLSLLLLALMDRRRLTLALVASYLVLGFSFPVLYRYVHYRHFIHEAHDPAEFKNQIESVVFHENASRWDNSILIDVSDYRYYLTALPAGIGINFVMDWTYLRSPIRSRYILIPPRLHDAVRNRANLKLVSTGKFGNLYENRPVSTGISLPAITR